MATKKKQAKEDGISLAEFRAWLDGIEEMQGPNWAPNAEQWKRIKAKFGEIREEVVEQVLLPNRNTRMPMVNPAIPPSIANMPTSAIEGIAAPRMGLSANLPSQTKTPDIDSSGGYQSSFV